jgi:GNAT superfamily N-acetyltransferase
MLSIIKIRDKKMLPLLMEMYEKAKVLLKEHRSGQWQFGEPSEQTISKDIQEGNLFGLFQDGYLKGACALLNKDLQYDHLIEGKWLNKEPYLVIHRFVIDPSCHQQGLGRMFISLIEGYTLELGIYNIRLDTHERNVPMKALLDKTAYQPCGKVHFPNIGERIVYHKILRK